MERNTSGRHYSRESAVGGSGTDDYPSDTGG